MAIMRPSSRPRHARLAVTSLLALATAGCPSMPMMTTAKTLGHDNGELTIAPGVFGFSLSAFQEQPASGTPPEIAGTLVLPEIALAYRHGIGERFELGATLSGLGHLALDGKIALVGNGKDESGNEDLFTLALDPTVGGVFVGAADIGGGYIDFGLPVLMDVAPTDWFRVTLGPRYRGTILFVSAGDQSESADLHYIGLGLGTEFVINETVALQPHGTYDLLLNPAGGAGIGTSFKMLTGGLAVKLRF